MAEINVNLTVNGINHTLDIDKTDTLLYVLREKLDLTGAKEGCGYGKCGSCTVVMNGEPVTSCTVRGEKINNSFVTTIEGLSKDGLHPIQSAFIEKGAVQCGFCSPGIIMRLYGLFNKNIDATVEEIKKALSYHICRCTGYESIIEAALLAQKLIKNNK